MEEFDFKAQLQKDMAEISAELGEWDSDPDLEEGEIKENVPLKCTVPECVSKTFKNMFTLRRHWIDIHSEQVVLQECAVCKTLFKRVSDVKRHAIKKHGGVGESFVRPVKRKNKFFVNPRNSVRPQMPRPFCNRNLESCFSQTVSTKNVAATRPILGSTENVAVNRPMPVSTKDVAATRPMPVSTKDVAVTRPTLSSCQEVIASNSSSRVVIDETEVENQKVLCTSRDMIIKRVLLASEKIKFWNHEKELALDELRKFDLRKKEAEISELKRKLKEERNIHRDLEQQLRAKREKTSIPDKMDYLDFIKLSDFE